MRTFTAVFLLLFCATLSGCADKPEVAPKTYGKILDALPALTAAEKPFVFPHAGDDDHKDCVFKEEDFF